MEAKPSVLYITYDGLTDQLGESQILPYLIRLAEFGARITILSCDKPAAMKKRGERLRATCAEAGITWESVPYAAKPRGLAQGSNWLRLSKAAGKLCSKKSIDIYHCRSLLPALIGKGLRGRFGGKLLFDMRGFWADERIEGGVWNPRNPVYAALYHYFRKQERKLVGEADHVVSLTRKAVAIMRNEMRLQPDAATIIPCCADLASFDYRRFDAEARAEARASLELSPDDYALVYAGSLGAWYMLEEMLAFFLVFQKKKPQAKFLFLTREPEALIFSAAEKLGVPNDALRVAQAERSEMPGMLSAADAGIFFIRPTFSKQASSPTKMAEMLGSGLPVIANAGVGDNDEILTNDTGATIKSFSKKAYSAATDQFLVRRPFDRARTRYLAENKLSLEEGAREYWNIYCRLA